MNIFKQEFRMTRKSLIIWSICIFVFIYMCMYKFSASISAGTSMNEILSSMPKSMQTLLGVGTFDLSTSIGYFTALFIYIALILGIHSAMIGARIISKEEEDKTSEFLMTKPVSREKIITMKVIVAFINILILNLVTTLSSIFLFNSLDRGNVTHDILILMLAMFVIQLIFLTIGFAAAATLNKPRRSVAIANGYLLFSFMLYIIIELSANIGFLGFLTPFEYYTPKMLLIDKQLNIFYTILAIDIIVISMIMTYRNYTKRDLRN